MSPVTTAFDPKPSRVRNIFICSAGRVLRFVENDERVVQRTAAHERNRRNFDGAAFEQPLGLLDVHHVVERVVERPQVRIDLLLQIARQEPELLAGFDGRARQDDAAHLLGEQVIHRLRHREIGLARAGRADAEHDVVLLDGVEIAALIGRLGRDAALARLPELPALEKVFAQIDVGIVGDAAASRSSRRAPRSRALLRSAWRAARRSCATRAVSSGWPSTMSSLPWVRTRTLRSDSRWRRFSS